VEGGRAVSAGKRQAPMNRGPTPPPGPQDTPNRKPAGSRCLTVGDPVVFTTADLDAMNERIFARRAAAPSGRRVDIYGPNWAEKILDTSSEIVAIHKDTGEPYPLDVHADLSVEDHCIVVINRLIRGGASVSELTRLIEAFGLPRYAQRRLMGLTAEASA
jgi:hypothetical protein